MKVHSVHNPDGTRVGYRGYGGDKASPYIRDSVSGALVDAAKLELDGKRDEY